MAMRVALRRGVLSTCARVGGRGVLRCEKKLSTTPTIPRTFEAMAQGDPESAGLAKNAKLVGGMLGEAMAKHAASGGELLAKVEELRKLGLSWRTSLNEGDEAKAMETFESIFKDVESLKSKELRDVARAFAHFLALLNAAEQEYRVRRLERRREGPLFPDKEDSCAGTLRKLLADGSSAEEIYAQLSTQQVEIVLTAHPTEVHRRTLLTKHRRATELLRKIGDGPAEGDVAGAYETEEAERELKAVVHALWGSDDLRRAKPTPQKEARGGLAFIETSFWDAVPAFLRRLDLVLAHEMPGGKALPLDAHPLKISSWMGGDRDGNPNVTAPVTREVVAAQRRKGAAMYLACLDALRLDLSVRDATDEFRAKYFGDDEAHKSVVEPYVALLDQLAARLRATVKWADLELETCKKLLSGATKRDSSALSVADVAPETADLSVDPAEPLFDSAEFFDALAAIHKSLTEKGYVELADGRLKDTIRRVGCFGLQLAQLDVRQESTRHTNAVDAVRAATGKYEAGSYQAMSSDERIAWLSNELQMDRPLLRQEAFLAMFSDPASPHYIPDPVDRDTIATCDYVKRAPAGAVGAYVISQATSAADVLAVELLLAEAGVDKKPRIAPLFETLSDLQNAPSQLRALFSAPGYLERVGYKQEIMVGYSDSAKDAGRLAASWAQYEAQEAMLAVAREFDVDVTFFHGKGGTVGRGGNPETYKAILAHPPETIQGRFRVTEQGEQIAFNFGEPKLAERSLDVFTAGVLRDAFRKASDAPISDSWRSTMATISKVSSGEYRDMVRHTPNFVPYFRAATPELELSALNVGSRPAKRNPKGGVESLRAIPWIFSWSQTRCNLPAWMGCAALADESVDPAVLRDMYENWGWFKTNVDLIETLLARTEPHIAALYDRELVQDKDLLDLGVKVRARLEDTVNAFLAISGRPYPASDNFLLQRALTLRNPYVDVLNLIQIEALKRRRSNPDLDDPDLNDALLVAINGIAAGLRNSG